MVFVNVLDVTQSNIYLSLHGTRTEDGTVTVLMTNGHVWLSPGGAAVYAMSICHMEACVELEGL